MDINKEVKRIYEWVKKEVSRWGLKQWFVAIIVFGFIMSGGC